LSLDIAVWIEGPEMGCTKQCNETNKEKRCPELLIECYKSKVYYKYSLQGSVNSVFEFVN
jgi:hypothetical protein